MTDKEKHAPASPDYGGKFGHAFFHLMIRFLGVYPAYVFALFLMPYYVLILSKPRREADHYLRHRFPEAGRIKRLFLSMRYFYEFSRILIDQGAMGILGKKAFSVQFPGWQNLLQTAQKRKGLILLTSHIGAWQYSMASMFNLGVPVHFNIHLEEHTSGRHFFDLADQQELFHIIPPTAFLGGMVEMTNALLKGECVAIMGDRVLGAPAKETMFLGEEASFPITPYHLAVKAGADIVVLLAVRTGKLAYRIEAFEITAGELSSGDVTSDKSYLLLKKYASCLESCLDKNPFMWLNFFNFWEK